jgi:hypothetical protein
MRHLTIIPFLGATLPAVVHQAPLSDPTKWDSEPFSNISFPLFIEVKNPLEE